MRINYLSCCFSGPWESELPYAYGSEEYKKLKEVLAEEVKVLVRKGVSCWYVGGQTGVDKWRLCVFWI